MTPMRLLRELLFAVLAASASAQVCAQTMPGELIRTAISDGQASGTVTGSVAANFNKGWPNVPPATPVDLKVSRIERFSDTCARLRLDMRSLGTDPKAAERAFSFNINICADGSPALQGLEKSMPPRQQ